MKTASLLDQIMHEKEEFAAKHGFDVGRIAAAAREFSRSHPFKPTRETELRRPGTSPLRSLMVDDENVAEVRRVRAELFEKAGGTLQGYMEMVRAFADQNPLPPPAKSRKMIPGYPRRGSNATGKKPRHPSAAAKRKPSSFRTPKAKKQPHS